MVSRRGALGVLLAAASSAAWAQEGPLLDRPGGMLLPAPPPGSARHPIRLHVARPWAQVLRTFGNPVLEGHFAVRAAPGNGNICLAMWDLGDRVLGLGQFAQAPARDLWEVVEVVMGRKPDIAIGRPEALYASDHFESAHWQLDPATARRLGRTEDVEALRWVMPARAIAETIGPFSRGLLPPVGRPATTHALWHEPLPLLPTGARLASPYRVGTLSPSFDKALAGAMRAGRMLAPLDGRAARVMLERNKGPALMPVLDRDGTPLGRVRILTL